MGIFGGLMVVFGISLIGGSLFYIYERTSLICERKYSECPKELLRDQYIADSLLLGKYLMTLLYGAGIICLVFSSSLGIDIAVIISSLCLLYMLINRIYYKHSLELTFHILKNKWKGEVNYKGYTDEVNVYRAIRDSQNMFFLSVVALIHLILLIVVL